MQTLIFHIRHPGEPGAGIRSFTETVTISAENDFGGTSSDRTDYFRKALEDWFDGARVQTEVEFNAEMEAENKPFLLKPVKKGENT